MDYILTRVTMLVYVICHVSVFALFPCYGKNMTVKSDLKTSDCRKYWEKLVCCIFKT